MDTLSAMNPDGVTPRAGRREWLGLAVLALPCLIYSMDLTVLNLALPRIAAALKPTSAQLLWIVDIYGFFVAGLLVTMGNLGDRIGRRRLLLIGGAAFGIASVAAASAHSPNTLIAARALLGVAGATLAPSTLSLIRNMFLQRRQRTFAIGVWTASYAIGGAIGPLLGGAMLQHFRWSSIFLLAVPPMALLLLLGPALLPESRDPKAKRMDFGSAALSLAAVLSIVYGLKLSVQGGLGTVPLLSVAAGIGLGALFVRRQGRLDDPLMDMRLLRTRAFGASLAIYMLATLVTFGSYVLVGQHLQLVVGLSPLSAGLWMLPWSASYVLGSFVAPLLARRFQPASVMTGGLLLATIGFLAAARFRRTRRGGDHRGVDPVFARVVAGVHPRDRHHHRRRAAPRGRVPPRPSRRLAPSSAGPWELPSSAAWPPRSTAAFSVGPSCSASRREVERLRSTPSAERSGVAGHLPSSGPGAHLLDAARLAFTHALQATLAVCGVVSLATAVIVVFVLRGAAEGNATTAPTAAVGREAGALKASG